MSSKPTPLAARVKGTRNDFRTYPRWREQRRRILQRDGERCHWCGKTATQVDHLIPVQLGGDRYDPANLVASCAPCNQSKGDRMAPKGERVAARSVFSRRGLNTAPLDKIPLPSVLRGDYSRKKDEG